MTTGLSEAIRNFAQAKYVRPAKSAGNREFAIRARDVWDGMKAQGFEMSGRMPQICSALRTGRFLRENGLEISQVVGPPSGQSPTVEFHYRLIGSATNGSLSDQTQHAETKQTIETPEEWTRRVTGKIRGILKDEIAAYGGGEAFLRWVRGYDDEDAA